MDHELLVAGNIAKDLISGKEKFGGSAAVIAINSSRLGISSGVLSVIGQDRFSGRYKDFLVQNGVNIELVSPELETLPECVATSDANSNTVLAWHDHNCHQTMETIKVDIRKALEYAIIHLVSCPPGLSRRLAQLGVKELSYEPGPCLLSDSGYLDRAVIDRSKFIFFNEEEYQAALAASGFRSQRDFLAESKRVMVITMGEKGSDVYLDSGGDLQRVHVDAIRAEDKVKDTTGAGDCYKAGFLAGYLRGKPLRECALIGSYMGAACAIQDGGILPPEVIYRIKRTCQL